MSWLLAALAILVCGGAGALLSSRRAAMAARIGAGSTVLACALGLIPAIATLAGGNGQSIRIPWSIPGGSFYLAIDPLTAFFLLPVFGLSALAAIYGSEYLRVSRDGGRTPRAAGPPWFFFNLLVAGMVVVVSARNAILFLVAWEVMSLASWFLVTRDSGRRDVREAGWTYLVATHLATAFLLALFVLLSGARGSLDFDTFGAPARPGVLFLLAIAGFGTKAGFMPLHVWLPEAHPAAPSHVSALMSGVMIKTGIYGLLRVLTFLGPPPEWWGLLLLGIGITSGVLGVLFALAQHDLKRLLAYSSVENIGIIAIGLGTGLVGLSAGAPVIAALGFGGALFHVLNHALFKGLLFLGAGAVDHATGTRELGHLGGLLRRMPWSAFAFLVGATAISGLPPLNGFASEFLIYLGAYHGVASLGGGVAVALVLALVALALIGGLAAACFARAFGIVFLGEPRSPRAAAGHDPGWAMRAPMLFLAAACLVVGVVPRVVVGGVGRVVATITAAVPDMDAAEMATPLTASMGSLAGLTAGALILIALTASLAFLRRRLLAGRQVDTAGTWDCGYAAPAARMQYTASSLAQPILEVFDFLVRTRRLHDAPAGFFPQSSALATETADIGRERLFRPAFRAIAWGLARFRWIQNGRLHLYVLYIAITLVALLLWRLR